MEVLLVLLGLAVLAYLFAVRNFKHWAKKGVSGPSPTPFLGNVGRMLLQTACPGIMLRDMYRETAGEKVAGFFVLDRPALLLRDPEVIRSILVKDFGNFVNRYTNSSHDADPMATRNMFLLRGLKWKELRATLSPTFTSGRMKQMFELVLHCATELQDYVTECARSAQPIEVKELLAKTSTDVITSCAFGIDSNCLRDPQAEFREFGRQICQYSTFRSLISNSCHFMPGIMQRFNLAYFSKDVSNFLRTVFWETVNTREKSKITRNDLIDLLIELKNKGRIDDLENEKNTTDSLQLNGKSNTFDFSGDDLVAQAVIFFLGGFETTSTTASFTLYELATAPQIQTRLRQEIQKVLEQHGGKVTYQAVHEMKYLDMVVSETLRKYPPLPFLDRECAQDYIIPGSDIQIDKGTSVYIPLMGLHYDPEYFPDPDKYDPERFSEEEKRKRPGFVYLPFGDGPRLCIGMRFGLMTTKTELIQILLKMEVCLCEDTPIPLKLNPKATLLATIGGIPLLFKDLSNPSS